MLRNPFVCACLCVHWQNISRIFELVNFVFGGSLPTDPGKEWLIDFLEKLPWVMVCRPTCIEDPKFNLNDTKQWDSFKVSIAVKQWGIGIRLMLDTTRSYMESPIAPLDLSLGDLDMSKFKDNQTFNQESKFYLRKNVTSKNRKPHIGSRTAPSTFDHEWP